MKGWKIVFLGLTLFGCRQESEPQGRMVVPVEDIRWTGPEEDSWLSYNTGSIPVCDSAGRYVQDGYFRSRLEQMSCMLLAGLETLDRVPMDRIERSLYNYCARKPGKKEISDPRSFLAFKSQDSLWVNLFAPVEIDDIGPGSDWKASISTSYPLSGKISIQVEGPSAARWTMAFRQPGWTDNRPDPEGKYLWKTNRKLTLEIDGEYLYPEVRKGYAYLTRVWTPGEVMEIDFPMSVRRFVTTTGENDELHLEYGPVILATAKDPKENLSLPDRDFLQKNVGDDGVDEWIWTHEGEEWSFRRYPEFLESDHLWSSSPYSMTASKN